MGHQSLSLQFLVWVVLLTKHHPRDKCKGQDLLDDCPDFSSTRFLKIRQLSVQFHFVQVLVKLTLLPQFPKMPENTRTG